MWRHSRNQLLPSSMLTSALTNSLQCRRDTGFQHTPVTEGQAVGGTWEQQAGGYSPGRGLALGALLSQVLGGGARGLGLPILLANAHPALSWPCRCFSSIGRSGGMQVVSLGPSCLQRGPGIILHELMHVLGFWHEHSRADRDRYIRVNWNEILPGKPGRAWWGRWRRGGLPEGGRHGLRPGNCLAIWERLSIFPTTCLSPMGKVGFLLSSKTRRITQMLLLRALTLQCHPQSP